MAVELKYPSLLLPEPVSAGQLVSTAEAKTLLRIDHSDEDTFVTALAKAAEGVVSRVTDRVFEEKVFDARFLRGEFPGGRRFDFPKLPVKAASVSLYYLNTSDVWTVIAGSEYSFDPDLDRFHFTGTVPSDVNSTLDVLFSLRFTAGYPSNIPEDLKSAALYAVRYLYEVLENEEAGSPERFLGGLDGDPVFRFLVTSYRRVWL